MNLCVLFPFSLYRKIFDLALSGAYSLKQLRDESFTLGLRGKRSGKKLSKAQMARLLRERFYCGEIDYRGEIWEGAHEPIISKDEFKQLQNILDGRARPVKQKREYPLSMIIKCACGHPLSGDNQKGHNYYRCSKAKGKEATCSHKTHYRQETLEEEILETLGNVKIPHSIIEWAIKQLQTAYKQETDCFQKSRKQNQRTYNAVRQKLTNLTEKWISPENTDGELLPDEEFGRLKRAYQKEEKELKALLDNTEGEENNWMAKCEEFFHISRKVKNSYQKSTPTEKRIILNAIGADFIRTSDKLNVELKKPFSYVSSANQTHKSIRTDLKVVQKQGFVDASAELKHWRDRRGSNPRPPP